jgi:hypothetical protein
LFILGTLVILALLGWRLSRGPEPAQAGQIAFSATFDQIHQDRPERSQLVVYSDGQGRVRTEEIGKDIFNLYDYNKRTTYQARKSAHVYVNTIAMHAPLPVEFGGYVLFDEHSIQRGQLTWYLGNQEKQGRQCHHYAGYVFFPDDRCEDWYAPELGCCPEMELTSPGFLGHVKTIMIDYKKGMPDPALFDLRNYREVPWEVFNVQPG